MIIKNRSVWTLLEYIKIKEEEIDGFDSVTGAFAIINVNGKFLIGHNKYRDQWEFPAGGIEFGETARKAAERELFEETHQVNSQLEFKGLFKLEAPNGEIKHQAIFFGFQSDIIPFEERDDDEMDKIMLWDLEENIGYVDECDLKIVELSCF